MKFSSAMAEVRDLFAGEDLGKFKENFTALVNPSGVRLLRLTPIPMLWEPDRKRL